MPHYGLLNMKKMNTVVFSILNGDENIIIKNDVSYIKKF